MHFVARVQAEHTFWTAVRERGEYRYGLPYEYGGTVGLRLPDGAEVANYASMDYLGLWNHVQVLRAASRAAALHGVSPHASRVLNGTTEEHISLEGEIAGYLRAEDAIVFPNGYMANTGVIPAVVGKHGHVYSDEESHASIVDGCRLSGASIRVFRHNDAEHLGELLAATPDDGETRLVVADGIYSMSGDIIDLPPIRDAASEHGALLMVDEAHSTGVLGATGRGVTEHYGMLQQSIDIQMGTFSKGLPADGGYVASSAPIIDYLRHNARSYIFTGAVVAPVVAAARVGLGLVAGHVGANRRECLRRNIARLRAGLGVPPGDSPIIPIPVTDNWAAWSATRDLLEEGIFVTPIVAPACPPSGPIVRVTVTAAHDPDEIDGDTRTIACILDRYRAD